MAGAMKTEAEGFSNPLTTSREPTGPVHAGDKGSAGDRALMDALFLIGGAWVVVIFLMFSLRGFNI